VSTAGLLKRLERIGQQEPSLDELAAALNAARRRWEEGGEIPQDPHVQEALYRILRFGLEIDLQMAGPRTPEERASMGPPEDGACWSEAQVEPFREQVRARIAELDRAFGVGP
jgi:hypothetical protein